MSDLLSDQRAKDLLAADPGVVNELVVMFRTVAQQAQSTADGLRGAAGDANWQGAAADAFRHGLGKLPDDLAKVTSSYQEAADGLGAFEGELSALKPAFQSIVSQLQGAQSQLQSAQSQLSSAQSALSTAQSQQTAKAFTAPLTPLLSVPANSPLHTAVNAATGAVANAQGEISALTGRGFHILDEFASARGSAQGRVSSASHVPPHRGFWDTVLHDAGSVMGSIGHFFEGMAVGIWNSVTGTWSALQNFAQHPTLENFGKLAGDIAVDASIVVLAAAAPEALGLLGAAGVAEAGAAEGGASLLSSLAGGLAAAGGPAETVGTVATGAHAYSDLLQGHYANFALDEVFMNIPSGSDVANGLGVGEQQAARSAAASEAMKTYSWFTDHGLTPGEAMTLMTDGEVAQVLTHVTNIDSRAEVATATSNAGQVAANAARTAARVGAPATFLVDGGQDHAHELSQEQLARILHGEPAPACP